MPLGEFSLIDKYFASLSMQRDDVLLGIGDDAAITSVPAGKHLVTATDTLVSGVHFLPEWSATDIAHKALAVNLSDMAAMGAEPVWFSLALTLPAIDEQWLSGFSAGLAPLIKTYNLQLIGGDTTQGPLAITMTVQGVVDQGNYLSRAGAEPGDTIYVTGELGAPALAVRDLDKKHLSIADRHTAMQALLHPLPRIAEGRALLPLAHSVIDISDGLAADLQHILDASGVAAEIDLAKLPVAAVCLANSAEYDARLSALTGGDDYQLCFTAAAERADEIEALAKQLDCPMTMIGVIEAGEGMRCYWQEQVIDLSKKGYEHFA